MAELGRRAVGEAVLSSARAHGAAAASGEAVAGAAPTGAGARRSSSPYRAQSAIGVPPTAVPAGVHRIPVGQSASVQKRVQ